MDLSAASGHIGPGEFSNDDTFLRSLQDGEFLADTALTHPAWCIDGRPDADGSTEFIPRSAGATIGLWVAQHLGGGDAPDDSETATLAQLIHDLRGIDNVGALGAHTGPTSKPSDSGCGAADHLPEILAIITDQADAVRALVESWGFEGGLLDDLMLQRAAHLRPESGAALVQKVAEVPGATVPALLGGHQESAAVVNLRPGTTLDSHKLTTAFPGAQVFQVDAWTFTPATPDPRRATALAAFNAGALLLLADPSLPYLEVQ